MLFRSCYRRVLLEQNTVSKEIMSERMKIENKFKDLLRGKEKYFDFDDILEIIFNEEDSDDLMAIVQIFDNSDISKLSDVLELATDAWNYFPHRSLDGKSPAEMVEEHNEDIKYQMEKSGYYNDDGELIDPDDMLLPEKCLLCAKLHDPNEEILCNLNRIDQSGSNNFVCEAFDRRKL